MQPQVNWWEGFSIGTPITFFHNNRWRPGQVYSFLTNGLTNGLIVLYDKGTPEVGIVVVSNPNFVRDPTGVSDTFQYFFGKKIERLMIKKYVVPLCKKWTEKQVNKLYSRYLLFNIN
tara:strand:- start:36 stop:386 length:351 start_codon:yes stop_codon:yes gene_type:complete